MRAASERGDVTPAVLAVGTVVLVMGIALGALVLESITMAETMARAAARAAAHAAANALWGTAGNAGSPGLVAMRNPDVYDPDLARAALAGLDAVPHGAGSAVLSCAALSVPNGHGLQRYYLDITATCTIRFVPPAGDLITTAVIGPIVATASAHLIGSLL
jgi:hypothetical protein